MRRRENEGKNASAFVLSFAAPSLSGANKCLLFVAVGWCSRSDGGRAAGRGRRAAEATARERSAGRAVRPTPRDARR
jgi:hypothetical protein